MNIRNLLGGVIALLLLATSALAYDLRYAAEIFLNGDPSAVAVNPATDTAAVVSRTQRSLTVIDLATAAVTREAALPETPIGLAVHRAANRAIVATEAGRLLFFDLAEGGLLREVGVGEPVRALAVDEARGVVLLGVAAGLKKVDAATGEVLPEIAVAGGVERIAAGEKTCVLVSCEHEATRLRVLAPEGVAEDAQTVLPGAAADLAIDEPLGLLLVTLVEQPGLFFFDLATLKPRGTLLTDSPAATVAVNPSTHRAYLAAANGALAVVDLAGKRLIETLPLFEQIGPFTVDPARNVALVGHGSNLAVVQLENPAPLLTGIVPDESPAGAQGVQLTVSGAKFIRDSAARFNQQPLSTGFTNNEHLTATIPPSELQLPGDVAVAVRNPPPGGGVSNELTFKILTPLPQIAGLAPEAVAAGSASLSLRVDGQGFMPSSFIHLGGKKLKTRFVSSTVLEAVVGPELLASEGRFPVTVTNPGEPDLVSNAATLKIGPEEPVKPSAVPAGFGSLTGRILNTEMWPIAGVTIKTGGLSTLTNGNGEFRLDNIPAGRRTVLLDGSTVNDPDGHYPTIPITVDITAGAANLLPFQPYFHRQKAYNFATIDPSRDTILTDPEVPGFEMRIPAGVNITGWDGKRNLRVSVRTVPTDRLPVKPLPPNAYVRTVYMYFFDKVGGGVPDRPIPIKSRNDLGLLPGEKAILWYFDESPVEGLAPNDWAIAGTGTVTPDGKYIVTDPGVGIPKFCCGASGWGGTGAPNPPTGPDGCPVGDPVDPATGYFLHEKVDLVVPGIIPVQIKHYYRSREGGAVFPGESAANGLGAFGKGTYFEYDWWLGTFQSMLLLIQPGNYQYRFDTQQADGSYINTRDPAMRGARVTVNADSTKTLRMRDGRTYKFTSSGGLIEIADRNGNRVTIQRRSDFEGGYIQSITTAEGKVITFNQTWIFDTFYQTDSISTSDGKEVKYTYEDDPFNVLFRRLPRLKQVEYTDGSTIQYGYDANGLLNAITNGRGIVEVTNEYNADKRITRQTHPDGGVYTFSYTAPSGYVTSTTMTAPNGAQTTWSFNSDGYITQKVTPDGTTTYTKATGTNELQSFTDPLGRTTSYTYYATTDARNGLVHTTTEPLLNVTTYEYETIYGLPTRVTDALAK
jgi:YD repeat-containing protein